MYIVVLSAVCEVSLIVLGGRRSCPYSPLYVTMLYQLYSWVACLQALCFSMLYLAYGSIVSASWLPSRLHRSRITFQFPGVSKWKIPFVSCSSRGWLPCYWTRKHVAIFLVAVTQKLLATPPRATTQLYTIDAPTHITRLADPIV